MNCFRHPDEVAIVTCRGCERLLCDRSRRQRILGVSHVCSEECAQKETLGPDPDPDAMPENRFQKVFAAMFLPVLLAIVGGGLCVFLVFSGKMSYEARHYYRRGYYFGLDQKMYLIFHALGINDWWLQFLIGASIGIAYALRWLLKYLKKPREVTEGGAGEY